MYVGKVEGVQPDLLSLASSFKKSNLGPGRPDFFLLQKGLGDRPST